MKIGRLMPYENFKQGINESIHLKFRGVATKYINDYILWYGFFTPL